jgi:hypothetical protein
MAHPKVSAVIYDEDEYEKEFLSKHYRGNDGKPKKKLETTTGAGGVKEKDLKPLLCGDRPYSGIEDKLK